MSRPSTDSKTRCALPHIPRASMAALIWAYMGPPDQTPELPKLEWARVPDSHRYISKRFQETNYLQAIEGGIDSSHSNFLHASVDAFRVTDSYVEKVRNSSNLRAKYHLLDKAPRFTVKKTDYGLVIAVRRNAEEDTYYWRLTQFLLPSHTMIPHQKGHSIHGHCWVPRDDETCWVWTMSWNPDAPLSQEDRDAIPNETFVHAQVDPVTFRPLRNKDNNYGIDREQQRTATHDRHSRLCRPGSGAAGEHGTGRGPYAGAPGHQRHGDHRHAPPAAAGNPRSSARQRAAWPRTMAMFTGSVRAPLLLNREVEFDDGARELMKAEV